MTRCLGATFRSRVVSGLFLGRVGSSWEPLGASWKLLVLLGGSWVCLGGTVESLGAYGGALGPSLRDLWARLGAVLGCLGSQEFINIDK